MKKSFCILSAAMAFTACSPSRPTQYIVNFDDQTVFENGPNAKCSDADPKNEVVQTTLGSNAILSLYQGQDANYYLDIGGQVVSGKQNNGAFTLSDAVTNVNSTRQDHTISKSEVVTVTFTQNDLLVSGSWKLETHIQCSGNNCSTEDLIPEDCIYKKNFRGRQLPNDGSLATAGTPGGNNGTDPNQPF